MAILAFMFGPVEGGSADCTIMTAFGPRPLASLLVDDLVLTRSGARDAAMRVRWIGRRRVAFERHPDPAAIIPVRIERDALGPGLPRRDLMLSPDHAILVQGRLVRIGLLVNGGTIRREPEQRFAGFLHVELTRHALMLINNLPCESFLDTGNRCQFGGSGVSTTLHADFRRDEHPDACLPLDDDPALVEPIRRRLAGRASRPAPPVRRPLIHDPVLQLRLVSGRVLLPEQRRPGVFRFWIGDNGHAGGGPVRLQSHRAAMPVAWAPWLRERHRQGVHVGTLFAWTRAGGLRPVRLPLGDSDGWTGWRTGDAHGCWTDGDATVPLPDGTLLLEVVLAVTPRDAGNDAGTGPARRCTASACPPPVPPVG